MKSPRYKLNIIRLILCSWILVSLPLSTCGGKKDYILTLDIIPGWVKRGESVVLRSDYDLKGDPLYSMKMYRGNQEFYRYTKSENPPSKSVGHTKIKVDLTASNDTHVTIRNVDFWLSGNFTCEVTADAPLFRTATSYNSLTVVEFPDTAPTISTEKRKYEAGDILTANCTTAPSKPNLELVYHLNNIEVGTYDTEYYPGPDDSLQWSRKELRVRLLPSHFDHGELLLRCTALFESISYNKSNTVILSNTSTEPIPERVLSPSSDNSSSPYTKNIEDVILSSIIIFILNAIFHG